MGFLSEDPHCTKPVSHCPTCRVLFGVGLRSGSADDLKQLGAPFVANSTIGLQFQLSIDVDRCSSHRRRHSGGSVGSSFSESGGEMGGSSGALRLLTRVVCLFMVGATFAVLLNLLQRQRKVTVFPPGFFNDLLATAWWVPLSCGIAGVVIGLLYPWMDRLLGRAHHYKREWSSVMRCVAVFVGINHASAKINFVNNAQLSLTLAALSIGLWWLFDQSKSGLLLGVLIATIATGITQLLVFFNVYWYSDPDFLYIRSWVPFIFFSGVVTMGAIGRQLAVNDDDYLNKEHDE